MRPDRIILGEVRGGEAIDMFTAMNTGHDGSLATVHANNTRDALARFETMVGIGMPNMGDKAIRETIARAPGCDCPTGAAHGWLAAYHGDDRGHGHGGAGHYHPGHLPLRAAHH